MVFDRLLELYSEGVVDNAEFIPRALACLDETNAHAILSAIPQCAVEELVAFVRGLDYE
jgi:hypothetical protein